MLSFILSVISCAVTLKFSRDHSSVVSATSYNNAFNIVLIR